ncbi:MAG: hypothetical protein ACI8WB_004848 [Phenylobacterium sp.]|jgi:hypothetical protein
MFTFKHLITMSLLLSSFNLYAEKFYIAPNGDDSRAGTETKLPLKTWSAAFGKMSDGDSLLVHEGMWTNDSDYDCNTSDITPCYNGSDAVLDINCLADYNNLKDINVLALSERRSFIRAGGLAAIKLYQCSGWRIEGMRARSKDMPDLGGKSSVVRIEKSDNLVFRKLLVTHNNRFSNTHLIQFIESHHALVEASEFYYFHRHGISVNNTSHHVTTRGNFFDSRLYADLADPRAYDSHNQIGDECITFYWAADNLSENDIGVSCEGIQATGSDNRIYGGIVLDSDFGFRSGANCNSVQPCNLGTNYPTNNEIKDVLAIRSRIVGIDIAASGAHVEKATSVDTKGFNFAFRDFNSEEGYNTVATIDDSVAVMTNPLKRNRSAGFLVSDDPAKGPIPDVTSSNIYAAYHNNTVQPRELEGKSNYSGFGFANTTGDTFEADPQLTCLLDLDESKLPATNTSAQVGADLRKKYYNGVKTSDDLFDADGNFSYCGAVIEGVNGGDRSIYMHSCKGIKEHLGLGVNGACKAAGM